ncbi:hypothetical protein BST61_g9059 [Cercospora zeina]
MKVSIVIAILASCVTLGQAAPVAKLNHGIMARDAAADLNFLGGLKYGAELASKLFDFGGDNNNDNNDKRDVDFAEFSRRSADPGFLSGLKY